MWAKLILLAGNTETQNVGRWFVSVSVLGMKELSPPPLNLRRVYGETVETEPVLLIISPGADPSQELLELASDTVGRENYTINISSPSTDLPRPLNFRKCGIGELSWRD